MQAIWIEDKRISLRRLEPPEPSGDEIVLRVDLAGICGTDLELKRGYYDFTGVPGHEFVATVIDGPPRWQGRRFVADINIGCGTCGLCRQGLRKHCRDRRVIGIRQHAGAFSEQVCVPRDNLFEVPEEIENRQAVFIEPLAAALQILEQVEFTRKTRVLIVGAGRLARIITMVLMTVVNRVSVVVRSAVRDRLFDVNVDIVRPDGISRDFDCVVECTGHKTGFDLGLAATRPGGQLIVKSTYAGALSLNMSHIVVDEINLLGSRCGSMQVAIDWLAEKKVTFADFKCEFYPLTDFELAFADAENPEIEKVMFCPSGLYPEKRLTR